MTIKIDKQAKEEELKAEGGSGTAYKVESPEVPEAQLISVGGGNSAERGNHLSSIAFRIPFSDMVRMASDTSAASGDPF